VIGWALACALWLRPPYSAALHGGTSAAAAPDPFDPATGIADERRYWVETAGTAHPVTVDDYLAHNDYARAGARVRRWEAAGRRGLLLDTKGGPRSLLPLRDGVGARIVASAPALGLYGYAAGDRVEVVDDHGLASVLAAHQRLVARGRPGHEKSLADAWVIAQFADPHAPLPARVDSRDVVAARRALACEPLLTLVRAPTVALSASDALDNLEHAFTDATYRFPPDPVAAAREVCGRRA
jgi:arabinofuranosyltransferase